MAYNNSGNGPLNVPGIGDLPVDAIPDDQKRCATGANDWSQKRLTAREVTMLVLMDTLTNKNDWDKKVFNDEIVNKWRGEALALPYINEKAFDWCIKEVRGKVEFFEKTKLVHTYNSKAACCKSDTLISEESREELKEAVKPLLEADEKDWHPNSDDKVLNLVHPSLFPLVYGKTRVLTNGDQVALDDILSSCGKGEIIPPPTIKSEGKQKSNWNPIDETTRWSTQFQWLPCEVKFSEPQGTNVAIISYINNLHPSHKSLYRVIEKFISLSIQPWNEVLINQYENKEWKGRFPYRIQIVSYEHEEEKPDWAENWLPESGEDGYDEALAKVKEYLERENKEEPDEELDPDWQENMMLDEVVDWKWKCVRGVKHPEAGDAYSYEDWIAGKTGSVAIQPRHDYGPPPDVHEYYDVNIQDEFRKQGLQVIVKLASIELTPDKPTYDGGNWHLEGMLNEHIAATAIYYYDCENVTDARLAFRQEAEMDETFSYPQDDHGPLCDIFGIESLREEPAVQEIGSVVTCQGRLVAFPNVLQHRVQSFKLEDPSRPGHRRFLVMWLIDPYYRIISTANVPPQRHDWWVKPGYEQLKLHERLPKEIEKMVKDEVGEWPMGMDEAKSLRLDLMAERTRMMPSIEQHMEEYNFCEH